MTEEVVPASEVEVLESICQHYSTNGKRCTTKVLEGYPLCKTHIKNATIEDIALVRSKDIAFDKMTGRYVTNPLEELAGLVSEVLTYKDYCAQQVARLRGEERYEGRSGEQLRAEVALYERSLDRAGKLLVEWSRLNIDDRLTRIEEAKAATILEVIRRSMLAAELSEDQRKKAEETAVKELRALGRKN
jgi:hypothetical protein